MKKRDVVELIRCHSEGDDVGFRRGALAIAQEFDSTGDTRLAEYVMALLSDANTLVPQMGDEEPFLTGIPLGRNALPLPEGIADDIEGVVNAIRADSGINRFMFYGPPGTGKTEAVKHVARILGRDLYMVDFDTLIDSKLGQTSKNITALFKEISSFRHPEQLVFLFDEIDALALDRTSSNDVREMGRATSTLLRELDRLDSSIALFATTNLFDSFDKALVRRFDASIDFNRYSREDLVEVAEYLLGALLPKIDGPARDSRLLKKILALPDVLPYPGDLSNILKTSVAFAKPGAPYDYLARLYKQLTGARTVDPKVLKEQGFTVREMERLTGISKSTLSRVLSGRSHE